MKIIYYFFFILTLFSNVSECFENSRDNYSVSKLIGMVRIEIIDQILLHLPKRKEVNILQMIRQMMKAKEEYSFNDTESAYLVFKWIFQNIKTNYNGDSEEPINVYNSGEGSSKGISSLFNNMCMLLKVETGSIPGYLKWIDKNSYEINYDKVYFWNYVEINGQYYLIDVSNAADINNNYSGYFSEIYLHFGTDPEIFIRLHFPKESKWQLLPEPYTFENFKSMALLSPSFYFFGYKTISPDTAKLVGGGKIVISSDKPIPELQVEYICLYGEFGINEYTDGSNKIEIEYDMNNEKCLLFCIYLQQTDKYHMEPIAFYRTNYTITDFNSENNNYLNLKAIKSKK